MTEFEDPKAPGAEKRRSTRIIKSIPITVMGSDALGQPFRESTNTVMINCYGCKYQSVHYVPKNTGVTIDVHRTHRHLPPRTVRGKVIWVQRPRSYQDVYHIGLEFEVAGNVWSLTAPPADWFPFPGDELEVPDPPPFSTPAVPKDATVTEDVLLVPTPVAVAEEFEVDCTVEMSANAQPAAQRATNGNGYRDRQNGAMREIVREIVDEKLTEHTTTMRRYFDDSLQQLLEKVYDRLQANAEESRTEIRSIREALTLVPPPAIKKPRAPRKRKATAPPVAV